MTQASLEPRVVRAADAALAERGFVAPIDVLIGIGWLAPVHVDIWRQGRAADLETLAQANLSKLSEAVGLLPRWAADRGLLARETVYVARTRDRHPLRRTSPFSMSSRGRSCASSRGARGSGPTPSPAMPEHEGAAGSAAAPRPTPSTRGPSPWRSLPRCATSTPATTCC